MTDEYKAHGKSTEGGGQKSLPGRRGKINIDISDMVRYDAP
jgi:hypothetical protein